MGDWVKSLHNPRNGADCTIQADSIPPGHASIQPWNSESDAPLCKARRSMHGTPICPKGCPFHHAQSTPIQATGRLTGLDLRNPLEIGIRSSKSFTPHFLGGVAPVAPSPRGWESACRVRRAPKPNCFGLRFCGSRIPLLRPSGSLEPLLCCAEGVVGARVCSVAQWWARSCNRSDAGRLARPMGRGDGGAAGSTRVDTNEGLDYTMAHVARSYGHRADKTSHTMSMSMYDPDCPHRSTTIESVKYCNLKLQYLLNR